MGSTPLFLSVARTRRMVGNRSMERFGRLTLTKVQVSLKLVGQNRVDDDARFDKWGYE
jgi:hypothetical protein